MAAVSVGPWGCGSVQGRPPSLGPTHGADRLPAQPGRMVLVGDTGALRSHHLVCSAQGMKWECLSHSYVPCVRKQSCRDERELYVAHLLLYSSPVWMKTGFS